MPLSANKLNSNRKLPRFPLISASSMELFIHNDELILIFMQNKYTF